MDHPRNYISVPAVPSPHEGTSYNPPVAAHTSLLRQAVEAEEKRAREEEELKRTKEKLEQARRVAQAEAVEGTAQGMAVQAAEDANEEQETGEVSAKKIPERKTKQERKKAEKLRAEVRPPGLGHAYAHAYHDILFRNVSSQSVQLKNVSLRPYPPRRPFVNVK